MLGHICSRIRTQLPDQRMQSPSTTMKTRITGVFLEAAKAVNIKRKEQRARCSVRTVRMVTSLPWASGGISTYMWR